MTDCFTENGFAASHQQIDNAERPPHVIDCFTANGPELTVSKYHNKHTVVNKIPQKKLRSLVHSDAL